MVRTPFVTNKSFTATGMPCNGPRYRPALIAAAARSDACLAVSAITVIYALSCVSRWRIRSSASSVSPTGETSPASMRDATSAMVAKVRSLAVISIDHWYHVYGGRNSIV